MELVVEDRQEKIQLPIDEIKIFAEKVLYSERIKETAELGIVLVDKESIRELNSKFRGIDDVTDVLAFDYQEGDDRSINSEGLSGDIAICPEVAVENAGKMDHSTKEEVFILVVHGILHLLGYDDDDDESGKIMEKKQIEIISQIKKTGTL